MSAILFPLDTLRTKTKNKQAKKKKKKKKKTAQKYLKIYFITREAISEILRQGGLTALQKVQTIFF